ncbi:hypothetical protein CQS95_08785 [Salmonella enterica]|nr:hypothetical protein [Salmonella enterica]EBL5124841.1 hypothetical protein [Salmonella enterica subsp. enterica serovar Rubislaw]EDV3147925.1 hypothetical protein [Salmonella enterica subsp. enterica serovar Chandans]EAW9117595.1 hypothetical protein [Salmonella enterica]EAY4680111.1 hypothetical protein [Salmonella enterica]
MSSQSGNSISSILWLPTLLKIFAIYALFAEHLGYGYLIATILAIVISFIPGVGEVMFVIGAIYGWNMAWYYAILILAGMLAYKYFNLFKFFNGG